MNIEILYERIFVITKYSPLFLKFVIIIEQKFLDVSLDSEKDYDNNIYYFILSALLGGRSIYEKIKLNDGE